MANRTLIGKYNIMGGGPERVMIGADDLAEIMAIAGLDENDVPSLAASPQGLGAPGGPLMDEAARRMAAAQIMARNAKVLTETQPTQARRFPLGFSSDAVILPGAQATITSQPQVLFRGERLIVPSDVAGDFTIDDCKVGKDSQFVATGPIPARTLQENAWGVDFQLDTAQVSQFISLIVTNIAGASRQFRATLIGSAVE